MAYGRYYEPIVIQSYEQYMKIKGHVVLFLDNVNYVLGATPDGKVFTNGEFGIIEVKCSEQYRDDDPKHICFIAKTHAQYIKMVKLKSTQNTHILIKFKCNLLLPQEHGLILYFTRQRVWL